MPFLNNPQNYIIGVPCLYGAAIIQKFCGAFSKATVSPIKTLLILKIHKDDYYDKT